MKNIDEIFKKNGKKIDNFQKNQFEKYFSFLIQENQKFNLTAITEEDDVILKHFLDSILPESEIKPNSTVVDVGSGAGFPAIPLKIMRPDLQICMVDSLNKRVNFLNETIQLLNLANCTAIHSRAEDFAKKSREIFDVAVARAVAPLNTLLEYLLPLVQISGKAIIYKSNQLDEELKNSQKALQVLGGKIEKIETFTLKSQNGEQFIRKILVVSKISHTPMAYPRSGNKPKVSPII